jgi:hypothetical protein
VQAAGIGWQPRTVQATRAGGCMAVAGCCDEWCRFGVRAEANGLEATAVATANKTVSAKAAYWPLMLLVIGTLPLTSRQALSKLHAPQRLGFSINGAFAQPE